MNYQWSEILPWIRTYLRDADSANYRWSDDELRLYFNDALSVISQFLPSTTTVTLDVTSGEWASVPTPTNFLRVLHFVTDELNGARRFFPYTQYTGAGCAYYVDAGNINVLCSETIENLTVLCAVEHDEIANDTDTVSLPRVLLTATEQYTCYLAHLKMGVSRANLEQWPEPGTPKVGNPLNEEAAMWLNAFRESLRLWQNGNR